VRPEYHIPFQRSLERAITLTLLRAASTVQWLFAWMSAFTVARFLLVRYGGSAAAPIQGALESVLFGILLGVAAWLVQSVVTSRAVERESANPRLYQDLAARRGQLDARLLVEASHQAPGLRVRADETIVALGTGTDRAFVDRILEEMVDLPGPHSARRTDSHAEFRDLVRQIDDALGDGRLDLGWHDGSRYVDLWHRIHRAEEARVELYALDDLDAELAYQELRIESSPLGKKSTGIPKLMDEIHRRVTEDVGRGDDPRANGTRVRAGASEAPPIPIAPPADEPSAPTVIAEATQVVTQQRSAGDLAGTLKLMREVRYAINDFRDRRIEALIQTRATIARVSVALGLGTWLLLVLALLTGATHQAIGAAAAFVLIGVTTGLFARMWPAGSPGELEVGWGYGQPQLHETMFTSGLAALVGVLLFSVSVGATNGTTALASALTVNLGTLTVAAMFALSPRLFLDRLRAEAKQYRSDLVSVRPGEGE
jgi:hypothetical protein